MRQAFQNSIDNALLHCRGAKQSAIYRVFDEFAWNLEDDEVAYAANKAEFKQGWVYFHTGDRLLQSRATWIHEQEEERQRCWQREQRREQERQAQASAAQMKQLERQYARAQAQQQAQQQAVMEELLRSQFEWLFRQGMGQAQQEAFRGSRVNDTGCPGYIEPMVRRFGLKWPFTAAELKKVYRKRCMDTHPDRGGSAEAFHQVQKDNQELERYAQGAA